MKMKVTTLLSALYVLSVTLEDVRCITNQEFFELVKDHVQDVETINHDDGLEDSNEDVIRLSGNGDDELDVPYLLSKIELLESLQDLKKQTLPARRRTRRVGWWHLIPVVPHVIRWFRRRSRPSLRFGKSTGLCHLYLDHEYIMNLEPASMKFRLPACLRFSLLTGPDDKIVFSLTNDKKPLLQKQISLKNSTTSCVPLAKVGQIADVCIETYRPDPVQRDSCVRMTSNIAIKAKRYKVYIDMWCGQMPLVNDDSTDIRSLMKNLQVSVADLETGEIDKIPIYDLITMFKEFPEEQGFDKGLGETIDEYEDPKEFYIED